MGWVENASPAVDNASSYPEIVAVCVCLTVFMLTLVSLRLYVRAIMLSVIGIDDWIIIFSAICSIVYNGLCIGQSKWGLGLPISLRPVVNLNHYSVINFAGRPFYQIGVLGFKVALCVAYLRILSNGQRSYRIIVWFVMVTCIMGHVACTLVLIFQCQPVQKSWLPTTPGACLANVPTFTGLAIVTIVYDIIIFLLPIPLLWTLQIRTRRKIVLMGVFLLGLFTTLCSFLRLSRIAPLAIDGNSTYLVLWGTIELNVGIALTCVPTLAPLFTYFSEKASNTYTRNYLSNGHELRSHGGESQVNHITSSKTESGDMDNDSQTFILDCDSLLEENKKRNQQRAGITKTVEVDVEYNAPLGDNLPASKNH